ncbi:MAG: hypothetical protein ACI97K_000655 [Glaciecola sp.]|jgi:hypothetical protein
MSDEKNQIEPEATNFRAVSEFVAQILSLNTESDVL